MSTVQDGKQPVQSTDDVEWGQVRNDHYGYDDEAERTTKRGLEDWELVEKMSDTSDHRIPYWFIAIFFVLLLVATGLTFPFWGVRPGFERSWFDWGIVAGAAWVTSMGGLIYYLVDYRHQRKDKAKAQNASDAPPKPCRLSRDSEHTKPMANRRGAKWRAVRVATVVIFAVAIAACGDRQQVDSAAATDNIAAAGEAAPLLQKWCTDCHLVPPAASHKVQEWRYIVLRMQGHRIAGGLGEIDKSDLERLISYFENLVLLYILDSRFGAFAGDAARGLRQFRSIFPAANMGIRAD